MAKRVRNISTTVNKRRYNWSVGLVNFFENKFVKLKEIYNIDGTRM